MPARLRLEDIYRLVDLVFPFDLHLLDTNDMSDTKRQKVKIDLGLLKQAQISAIKMMIELNVKPIKGLSTTHLLRLSMGLRPSRLLASSSAEVNLMSPGIPSSGIPSTLAMNIFSPGKALKKLNSTQVLFKIAQRFTYVPLQAWTLQLSYKIFF